MIKPDLKGTAVTFGPCRLCYVHVFERHKFDGDQGEGKYSCIILIPKDETETVNAVKKAIQEAQRAGMPKWGGKLPKNYRDPLQDGDEKEDEILHGHWYLNAKSNSRPLVVRADRDRSRIDDPEEVYSGVWAVASVSMFPYNKGGNGVGVSLAGVMKYKDGERIGGGTGAASAAFQRVELDDESDDEL